MNEAPGRAAAETGQLQATLEAGRFAITAEVNPPLAGKARFLTADRKSTRLNSSHSH